MAAGAAHDAPATETAVSTKTMSVRGQCRRIALIRGDKIIEFYRTTRGSPSFLVQLRG